MRKLIAALALAALACGGGAEQADQEDMAASDNMEPAAGETASDQMGTGTVHTVDMLLTPEGSYIYRPDRLTIKVGDTVRWVMISGAPHNVAFWEDSIPQGARETLVSAIPAQGKLGPLSSALLTQPNATVEVKFAGVPTGRYAYFCTPHLPLGMTGVLTIEQ
jgi:plastocyanin